MGYRSGSTLVRLMREARQMTDSAEVLRHLDAALDFATAGPDTGGHRYPRGAALVRHLRDASASAGQLSHTDLSTRLSHFADYAAGEIPLSLLETWYIPGYRQYEERFMQATLAVGLNRSAQMIQEFAKERPNASVHEANEWFQKAAQAMEQWTIGESQLGGIQLKQNTKDHLTWLKRIQLVFNDSSDQITIPPDVVEEISEIPGSELIAQAVQWRRRRSSLARLRTVIESPKSTERDIHKELKQQTWIFGGRYVKEIARRRLTTTDEIDIPLLRGDGSLHVIELKKAVIPNLVEPLRSHYAVGTEVHRAVSQAANYLRSLDENRALILAEHGIECRRTFATVLIGHPKFIDHAYDPAEVAATLRTYNAALSRIEVITYEELIEAAERTLRLDEEPV
jgi:hypothetical protein